jgi:hypothetical protein
MTAAKTPSEQRAAKKRAMKIVVGVLFAAGALKMTVLAPGSDTGGDNGLPPAGAETPVTGPQVTYLPIQPTRDPFLPVNGG